MEKCPKPISIEIQGAVVDNEGMQIKIWGARGSLPAPAYPQAVESGLRSVFHEFFSKGHRSEADLEAFFAHLPRHRFGGYGGHTPSVRIARTGSPVELIIDAGSGIRALSDELMQGPCGQGKGVVHIFFTHFHWDHLIGLPFFAPMFVPGNEIHAYSVQPELREVFESVFKKPFFPVQLKDLGAKIHYHRLSPRVPFCLGTPPHEITLTPFALDHPDPCWGYKVEAEGKSYAHCVDTECTRASREALGPDLPLYQGIDLMVFDAQYTLMETLEKANWGHAAASVGLDIAIREGIKRVLFMHHDPSSSAEKIALAEAQARRYYESQAGGKPDVEWSFAFDGQMVEL